MRRSERLTSNHWGLGVGQVQGKKLHSVGPHPDDPEPSGINDNIASSLNGDARVLRPAIRKGWLDGARGNPLGERGQDEFVEVEWEVALDLIASELNRVRSRHGNEAIFAGTYGWASAGRFHHAQSQLKRFLNTQGGFTHSWGNYSYQAALVLFPHIVGDFLDSVKNATRFTTIAEHGELVLMFGGIPPRSMQVSDGGIGQHRAMQQLEDCARSGVRFVNISPLKADADDRLGAEWIPIRPGSDTAVMMAMAYVLIQEELCDHDFLNRYTVGFDRVRAYILGEDDGIVKSPDWAEQQSGVASHTIVNLAREAAAKHTMLATAAGLQRADYGEQPLWMTVTLAAMLGQIGLPGRGFTVGYGVNGNLGVTNRLLRAGVFSQGPNPLNSYIPVAMITEMLMNPGGTYDYNGESRVFPDIKMVWWAGGNPFHHHQDLNKLRQAFQRPETVIVNEINWTSTARHADIVLPVAAPEERDDIVAGYQDNYLMPKPKLVDSPGEARLEYNIYRALEQRMGNEQPFSEGRGPTDWLRAMWSETKKAGASVGMPLPDWETFFASGIIEMADPTPGKVYMSEFRADPETNPLPTPSGRIELYSETIASFGYDDCLGQATWFPPRDVQSGQSEKYPLAMISGQPETRLHSQLDNGDYSVSKKINGREPVLVHPEDAHVRGIDPGDVVEMVNGRGRCLAAAVVTENIAKGTVFLWTGAWYDPDFEDPEHRDRHGNPNVLTHDARTSRLSQGPAAHSTYVEISRHTGDLPEITVHNRPNFVR